MIPLDEKIDPELVSALKDAEPVMTEHCSVKELQAFMQTVIKKRRKPFHRQGLTIFDDTVDSDDDFPSVKIRIYSPDYSDNLPVLIWMGGGGFICGDVYVADKFCGEMALSANCIVVSVDYRLAPKHPYPAALDDCYKVLSWLLTGPAKLKVDISRLAVGGMSAGACLAAALSLRARDNGLNVICYQMLVIPVLDDRHKTPSSFSIVDARVWNRNISLKAWRAYLADVKDNVPTYASPARESDFSGLPRTFISVAEHDILRDEGVIYAQKLLQAGVSTELHIYRGVLHGSLTQVPEAAVNRRHFSDLCFALERGLNH